MSDHTRTMRAVRFAIRSIAALAGGLLAPLALVHAVLAQDPAWNPHPGDGDVVVPMPGAYKMVFVKVPVPGKGVYGGNERIFELGGDKQSPSPYQYPRQMRIGPTFRPADGEGFLVFGKYEVTIGQYAAMAGEGDIAKGLAKLAEISSIDQLKKDGTRPEELAKDQRFLARALHGLSVEDYHDFIARFNAWCLTTEDGKPCAAALKKQLGGAGFFRLPFEPEWEYVARGGATLARAGAPLPFPAGDIEAFALVGSKRTQPDEIGKFKPLPSLPIYDIYGNVSELMGGMFTVDNGTGAVGGSVARGGDFKTQPSVVRSSYREEIPHFVFRKATGLYAKRLARELGIRLVVGAVVRNTIEDAQAETRIADEFQSSYVPCCGGGASNAIADGYGNNIRTAKDIGTLVAKKDYDLNDSVGGPDDPADFFRFLVPQFGTLRLGVRADGADVIVEVKHAIWDTWKSFEVKAGRANAQAHQALLPGPVWVKIYTANASATATWRARMSFEPFDCCGSTPDAAKDLGVLTTQLNFVDYVGTGDLVDFFKFRIERQDTINLRLLELTGDADVELWDAQKNIVAKSLNPGNQPEQIEFKNAPVGDYYVRVFAKDGNTQAVYKLALALGTVHTAGPSRATARDLGTLSGQVNHIAESVGGPQLPAAYFKLKTTQPSMIRVQVSRAESAVFIALHDENDREIERGVPSKLNPNLVDIYSGHPPGTYYVVVRSATGAAVPYTMTVDVRPAAQHGSPSLAHVVQPGSTPIEYRNTLSKEVPRRFLTFTLSQGGTYRITLDTVGGDPGADLDLDLYRMQNDWTLVARSDRDAGLSELIEQRLDPGRYLVMVLWHPKSRGNSAEGLVRITQIGQSGFQSSGPPGGNQGNPPPPNPGQSNAGNVVGDHGPWKATVTTDGNRRFCNAFTDAVAATPGPWRNDRPRLILQVAQGEPGLFHSFDKAQFFRADARIDAAVKGPNGSSTIPLRVHDGHLKAVEPCANNPASFCTIIRGMQSLNAANEIIVTGTSATGQLVAITYSLSGYRPAVHDMNVACNTSQTTGWLER